uniref:Na_H_Exchanger domain-containing protein n=1 Tax=Macrostomum lignano TaxID=282301 RepID=A0A1I8IXK5_9PLAT
CVLGSLICVHDDLKPFLVTALWLLFLVVLLLVFERTESTPSIMCSIRIRLSALMTRLARCPPPCGVACIRFCNKVLLHGIKEYLPTSCLQILLGLAFAGAFQLSGYHIDHLENLNPGLFFHFLLPIIIINAGFGVEKRHFYFNLPAILSFAVIGTIIVALVIGYCIYAMSIIDPSPFSLLKNVTKIEALTFGALISAVDPVAVLALFERMHLNKPLYMTLFGESVLNDAVSVVRLAD